MSVDSIQPGETIGAHRGDIVVCIPIYGGHEHFVPCLHSVLMHTPPRVPILICDDASPDRRSEQFVHKLGTRLPEQRRLLYSRRERNVGFPANVNGAMAAAAPADVIILNSDCTVAEGWIDGLREAAKIDSRVATVTALTNTGTIASVPGDEGRVSRLPQQWRLEDAAAAIRTSTLRIRPRLPTAVGHCMLIRRSALELVGDFDLTFTPGYGEEVDFSQRCLQRGLCHVLADDVYVQHEGGASFGVQAEANHVQEEHEQVIASRYPYYHGAVQELVNDVTGPLARAISVARRTLIGLSVVIDAQILSGPMTGTQLHVLEVIAALARTGDARLAVVLPDRPGDYAARMLAELPDVHMLTRAQVRAGELSRADVVHRPYQVANDEELAFLAPLGERLIVTNQDLISYHNPAYFQNASAWHNYRRLTRSTLADADRVIFLSEHARVDALAEDLLEPERASVVHAGVDHTWGGAAPPQPATPRNASRLPADSEAILCLGTDFRHKNRVFALRVLERLRERHHWPGYLLLAGPHVSRGSSVGEEAELFALHPGLQESVIDFGAVTEAEKAWLYRRARVVLYPTVHEGFGLVPFEAADHGTPCLWAAGTSLAEVLAEDAAGIVAWSTEESADRVLALSRDAGARGANLQAVERSARALTWDAAARKLIELYGRTCDLPSAPGAAVDRRYGVMRGTLSEDAMRLVGPGGALDSDVERPLLALATHPQIGNPVFRTLKLGYRASFRLRRRALPGRGADQLAGGNGSPEGLGREVWGRD